MFSMRKNLLAAICVCASAMVWSSPSVGLSRIEHERAIASVRSDMSSVTTTLAARVFELAQQTTLLSVAITNALTQCAIAMGADASVVSNAVPMLAAAIEQEREALVALQRSNVVLIDEGQPQVPSPHTLYTVEWHGSNEWASVLLPRLDDRVQSYYYLVTSTNRYELPWRDALYDQVSSIDVGTNMVVITTMGQLGLLVQSRLLEAKE